MSFLPLLAMQSIETCRHVTITTFTWQTVQNLYSVNVNNNDCINSNTNTQYQHCLFVLWRKCKWRTSNYKPLPNLITIAWLGHVARTRYKKIAIRLSVDKNEWKRQNGRPRSNWGEVKRNDNLNFRAIMCNGVRWIHLADSMGQWRRENLRHT